MKTSHIVAITKVLEELATIDVKHRLELAGLQRVKLARARRELGAIAADFQQAHDGLVRQYGKPTEGKDEIRVAPKTKEWTAFVIEANKLLAVEVENVPALPKFTEEELALNLDKLGADFPDQLVDQLLALGLVVTTEEAK